MNLLQNADILALQYISKTILLCYPGRLVVDSLGAVLSNQQNVLTTFLYPMP